MNCLQQSRSLWGAVCLWPLMSTVKEQWILWLTALMYVNVYMCVCMCVYIFKNLGIARNNSEEWNHRTGVKLRKVPAWCRSLFPNFKRSDSLDWESGACRRLVQKRRRACPQRASVRELSKGFCSLCASYNHIWPGYYLKGFFVIQLLIKAYKPSRKHVVSWAADMSLPFFFQGPATLLTHFIYVWPMVTYQVRSASGKWRPCHP